MSDTSTVLTDMEKDVIGEVMNISMGSGATAMSTVLDAKVNITTPRIEVVPVSEFDFASLEPVVGVSIKYVEGIDGVSVLLLREVDLKKILCHLLSMEDPDEVVFDEIATSAVCEIMNQMMGSSASALAQFLGKPINISPPEIVDAEKEDIKGMFALKGDDVVSIKFDLNIDELVSSEFISAMEPALVREIVEMTMSGGMAGAEEEVAAAASAAAAAAPAPAAEAAPAAPAPGMDPAAAAAPAPEPAAMPQQPAPAMDPAAAMAAAPAAPAPAMDPAAGPQVIQPMAPAPAPAMPGGMPQQPTYGYPPAGYPPQQPMYQQPMYQQPAYPQQPPAAAAPQVNATPYAYKQLGDAIGLDLTDSNNLELVMSVPIQITVELGTTKKKIKDIIDLCQGNIVELDRQAGDQVDILANGRLIAKGDVVVVDDNYSVRVTEIVKRDNEGLI